MPEIRESRDLPYTARQIYDLVADVAAYPEFLPWTQSARIRARTDRRFEADLVMGFQFVRETFTSRVTLYPDTTRVHAEGIGRGPFSKLINDWQIQATGDTTCHVDFRVEFEIRNFAIRRLVEPLYTQAQRQAMDAFEGRARALYSR